MRKSPHRTVTNDANRSPCNVIFRDDFTKKVQDLLNNVVLGDHQAPTQSCLTCNLFNEQYETCMGFNPPVRPPARVIAYGCDGYQDHDGIPY